MTSWLEVREEIYGRWRKRKLEAASQFKNDMKRFTF
jgi:hypothetical protein